MSTNSTTADAAQCTTTECPLLEKGQETTTTTVPSSNSERTSRCLSEPAGSADEAVAEESGETAVRTCEPADGGNGDGEVAVERTEDEEQRAADATGPTTETLTAPEETSDAPDEACVPVAPDMTSDATAIPVTAEEATGSQDATTGAPEGEQAEECVEGEKGETDEAHVGSRKRDRSASVPPIADQSSAPSCGPDDGRTEQGEAPTHDDAKPDDESPVAKKLRVDGE